MPTGRPTDYTTTLAEEICSQIAMGKSLRKVIEEDDTLPSRATIYNWFGKYPEFVDHYARAKSDSADSDADRIEHIAESVLDGEVDPAAGRVAMDAYKWTAGKKRPRKYGDRIHTELSGNVGLAELTDEQIDARFQALVNASTE